MRPKNIAVLFPKSCFSEFQLERLAGLGKVAFADSSKKCAKDTEVLVFDGSIAKAKSRLSQLLDSLPNIKYLVLGSSDLSFVDLIFCKEKGITISFVPAYDARSKAEHVIALLFACARRILINDRRTYRRKYQPELGNEIRGKRLGVVGSGLEVEDVVRMAKAVGMTVYTEERIDETIRQPLDNLLSESDFITLHLTNNEENKNFLSKEMVNHLKPGVIVINLSGRDAVNERAIAEALKTRKIDQYIFESESMGKSPLKGNEYALMLKPSSTYTQETQEKNIEAVVRNIEGIVRGLPFSKVEL